MYCYWDVSFVKFEVFYTCKCGCMLEDLHDQYNWDDFLPFFFSWWVPSFQTKYLFTPSSWTCTHYLHANKHTSLLHDWSLKRHQTKLSGTPIFRTKALRYSPILPEAIVTFHSCHHVNVPASQLYDWFFLGAAMPSLWCVMTTFLILEGKCTQHYSLITHSLHTGIIRRACTGAHMNCTQEPWIKYRGPYELLTWIPMTCWVSNYIRQELYTKQDPYPLDYYSCLVSSFIFLYFVRKLMRPYSKRNVWWL